MNVLSILPKQAQDAHWYTPLGQACHEVPRSDGSGMRPTTLRDARKLGLLPSVTTILKTLHKQALVEWLITQACMSVLTAPKLPNEDLDAFVTRVLKTEKQQDQEAQKARDLGTEIHAEIHAEIEARIRWLGTVTPNLQLSNYVDPVLNLIDSLGVVTATEKIVVGNGYAGTLDAIVEGDWITVLDFKSAKKLPDCSWPEHLLQLSAYAQTLGNTGRKRIRTANIYISTTEPGQCRLCIDEGWQETFLSGFEPLVKHWQWATGYRPL